MYQKKEGPENKLTTHVFECVRFLLWRFETRVFLIYFFVKGTRRKLTGELRGKKSPLGRTFNISKRTKTLLYNPFHKFLLKCFCLLSPRVVKIWTVYSRLNWKKKHILASKISLNLFLNSNSIFHYLKYNKWLFCLRLTKQLQFLLRK